LNNKLAGAVVMCGILSNQNYLTRVLSVAAPIGINLISGNLKSNSRPSELAPDRRRRQR